MANETASLKIDRLTNALTWFATKLTAASITPSQQMGDEENNINYPLCVFWPEDFEGEIEDLKCILRVNLLMKGSNWSTITTSLKLVLDILEDISFGGYVPGSFISSLKPVYDAESIDGVNTSKVGAAITVRISL